MPWFVRGGWVEVSLIWAEYPQGVVGECLGSGVPVAFRGWGRFWPGTDIWWWAAPLGPASRQFLEGGESASLEPVVPGFVARQGLTLLCGKDPAFG